MDNLRKILKAEIKNKKEFETSATNLKNSILEAIYLSDKLKDYEKDFWAEMCTFTIYTRQAKIIDDKIKKLKRWIAECERDLKPPKPGQITEADIARAKEYPMENLIKTNRTGFACCPFHHEKTPSLKVNKDNTWHCFGCGKGHDTIDFLMLSEGIDFIKAVKRLI